MARAATSNDGGEHSWEFPCREWFGTLPGHKLQRDLKVSGVGSDRYNQAQRIRGERLSVTDSESLYSLDETYKGK